MVIEHGCTFQAALVVCQLMRTGFRSSQMRLLQRQNSHMHDEKVQGDQDSPKTNTLTQNCVSTLYMRAKHQNKQEGRDLLPRRLKMVENGNIMM